jgi:hypothetical protein
MNVATIRAWRLIAFLSGAAAISAQQPVRLAPRFEPGWKLRYALEFRTESRGQANGDIENPAAPKRVELQVSGVVRLEVLRMLPSAEGGFASVRLRATYEKLAATAHSDLPDPQLAEAEAQIKRFEGRAIEYTLAADGAVSELTGLDDLLPEQRVVLAQMFAQISLGKSLPPKAMVLGEKWSFEMPSPAGAPLLGYVWRTESTYLRNEPCRAAAAPAAGTELCAVILSRGELRQVAPHKDPTPPEYARNQLRTAGKMSGSTESLTYVSLAYGYVVSVTQSGAESSDITISGRAGELRLRYAGSVASNSQITLLESTR